MVAHDLASLYRFARHLHRREWCITRLPAELGAKELSREVEPVLLGVAAQGPGRRAVGINELIRGTPLEIPVIAHECAHLLLGHAVGYCLPGALSIRQEHDAWNGAALLALPSVEAVDEQWLIRAFSVPRELIAVRRELGDRGSSHAAYPYLSDWILRVADAIDLPAGWA